MIVAALAVIMLDNNKADPTITLVLELWLAAGIASETATKHPRRLFQTFLKILFICFLQGKKKLKRFDQHRPSTALVETFEDWRKNLSLNAFVERQGFAMKIWRGNS